MEKNKDLLNNINKNNNEEYKIIRKDELDVPLKDLDGIGKDIVNSTNFLFFSFYIKAMKGLFESFKKRKYIDQMYMAENKENQKYYFIIGKYYERRLQ